MSGNNLIIRAYFIYGDYEAGMQASLKKINLNWV